MSNLNDKENDFCLLFVDGQAPYAGNACLCYEHVYGVESEDPVQKARNMQKARELISRHDIQEQIKTLGEGGGAYDQDSLKRRITSTMMSIMDECSTSQFNDRRGNPISPAALRSVSIAAAKLASDINGVKQASNPFGLPDPDGEGMVFNLIVPEKRKQLENKDDGLPLIPEK